MNCVGQPTCIGCSQGYHSIFSLSIMIAPHWGIMERRGRCWIQLWSREVGERLDSWPYSIQRMGWMRLWSIGRGGKIFAIMPFQCMQLSLVWVPIRWETKGIKMCRWWTLQETEKFAKVSGEQKKPVLTELLNVTGAPPGKFTCCINEH